MMGLLQQLQKVSKDGSSQRGMPDLKPGQGVWPHCMKPSCPQTQKLLMQSTGSISFLLAGSDKLSWLPQVRGVRMRRLPGRGGQ